MNTQDNFTIKMTTTSDPIYIEMCKRLDDYLDEAVGADVQSLYKQYLTWDGPAVIVYDADEAIASGGMRPFDEHIIEFKRFYVLPKHRNKGLARLLFTTLEEEARKKGYDTVRFETDAKLTTAIKQYEACGYERIPNYGPYENMPDSYCMGKKL